MEHMPTWCNGCLITYFLLYVLAHEFTCPSSLVGYLFVGGHLWLKSIRHLKNVYYLDALLLLFIYYLGLETHISNSSSGFLVSPYYPSFYLNNMHRLWTLDAPAGQRIKLGFLFLNLEEEGGCTGGDFISIEDLNKAQHKIYCGSILPKAFISKSSSIAVKFHSNKKYVRSGFKIRYEAVDGKNLKDDHKLMSSLACLNKLYKKKCLWNEVFASFFFRKSETI